MTQWVLKATKAFLLDMAYTLIELIILVTCHSFVELAFH